MRRINFIGGLALAFALGALGAATLKNAQAQPPLTPEQRTAIELVKVCSADIAIEMFSKQQITMTVITCNVPLPETEPQYNPTRTVTHHGNE